MSVAESLRIALVAEDELSMAVMERVVLSSGRPFVIARRLMERGFGNIKRSVQKYRQASYVLPHVVLTDLDNADCPASLRRAWGAVGLPDAMLFRVAVRETESWLLGDRNGFATFASVPKNKMPARPEDLPDPKAALLGLARRSRRRRLALELLPPQGSAVSIGPLYNERLSAFARDLWDIDSAATICPSLQRTRERLRTFLSTVAG